MKDRVGRWLDGWVCAWMVTRMGDEWVSGQTAGGRLCRQTEGKGLAQEWKDKWMVRTTDRLWCQTATPFTAASRDTAGAWSLLFNGSTAHALLTTASGTPTREPGAGLGWGREGRSTGWRCTPPAERTLKALQLQAATNFGFCFQASILRKAAQRRGHGLLPEVMGPQACSDSNDEPHQYPPHAEGPALGKRRPEPHQAHSQAQAPGHW